MGANTRIYHFLDLHYTVEATPGDYVVDYRIFEIAALGEDQTGDYTVPFYERADSLSSVYTTEALADAEPFITGGVKWDGCSNWSFHTEACMYHACDKQSLEHIGQVLAKCWELTATLCPNWYEKVMR